MKDFIRIPKSDLLVFEFNHYGKPKKVIRLKAEKAFDDEFVQYCVECGVETQITQPKLSSFEYNYIKD